MTICLFYKFFSSFNCIFSLFKVFSKAKNKTKTNIKQTNISGKTWFNISPIKLPEASTGTFINNKS